jgi:hypothetical protein
MKRRLRNICSAVSLLLSIVLVVLWVRSYYIEDVWDRYREGWEVVKICGGVVELYRNPISLGVAQDWEHASWNYACWRSGESLWGKFGFSYDEDCVRLGPGTFEERSRSRISFLIPVLLTLVMPAVSIIRHIGRRRRLLGSLCGSCGYDMRGTPQRCPECGEVAIAS